MGEYSCRCHGKRVISAPSKPLKLKLAGHILYGEIRLRTKGFCSAPLRSRDIRDKVRNGILALFRDQIYFSATKQRQTKSFGTHVHNTSNNTSTKLQLRRIKLHIEIVNLKPVTPTTILLPIPWRWPMQSKPNQKNIKLNTFNTFEHSFLTPL